METAVVEKTPKEIKEHFKTGYASSPKSISDYEIKLLRKAGCCCESCGKSVFGLWDFPEISKKGVYCEECDREKNYDTCPICEDYYEKVTKPEDTFFVVSKESENDAGVKAGFYAVKGFPYFVAQVAFGFDFLLERNIELLRECDINSMLRKMNPHLNYDKINASECCRSCKDKYCGITPLKGAKNRETRQIIKLGY